MGKILAFVGFDSGIGCVCWDVSLRRGACCGTFEIDCRRFYPGLVDREFFSDRIYWFVTSQGGDSPELMLWECRKKIVKDLRENHFCADSTREPVFADVDDKRGVACLLPVIHDSGVPGQVLLYLRRMVDERMDMEIRNNLPNAINLSCNLLRYQSVTGLLAGES